MEYLNSEEVDFAAYLKATETQEKIREAKVYLEKWKSIICINSIKFVAFFNSTFIFS